MSLQFIETEYYTDARKINKLLAEGWMLLETGRHEDGGVFSLLGKPLNVYINELKSIIRDYENAGCQEALFEYIAQGNGETLGKRKIMKLGEEEVDVGSACPLTDKYVFDYKNLTK